MRVGRWKKEALREAGLGVLGCTRQWGTGLLDTTTGSDICICGIGFGLDSDQTRDVPVSGDDRLTRSLEGDDRSTCETDSVVSCRF